MKMKLMKKPLLSGAGALIQSDRLCLARSWRGSRALAAAHGLQVLEENFVGTIFSLPKQEFCICILHLSFPFSSLNYTSPIVSPAPALKPEAKSP